jgi:hypothetical protein
MPIIKWCNDVCGCIINIVRLLFFLSPVLGWLFPSERFFPQRILRFQIHPNSYVATPPSFNLSARVPNNRYTDSKSVPGNFSRYRQAVSVCLKNQKQEREKSYLCNDYWGKHEDFDYCCTKMRFTFNNGRLCSNALELFFLAGKHLILPRFCDVKQSCVCGATVSTKNRIFDPT